MKTKLLLCLCLFLLLALTSCQIPVVGNSPEEIKHRDHPDDFD